MIRCIIVDDEQHGLDLISSYVKQTNVLELQLATTSALAAINKILTEKIDLVFLDMHMPEMGGLEFIQSIQGKSRVVLCTAFSEYALQGFDHDVVDYLLKPVSYPRFLKAVQKTVALMEQQPRTVQETDDFLFVKTEQKGKMVKVEFDEVNYVEGLGNYVGFMKRDGTKIVALFTMKEIEQVLPQTKFLRVHNSYIINKNLVAGIEGNELLLKNESRRIPIGITYKDEVLASLKIKK